MSFSLEVNLRQTLIVVKEGNNTRKVDIPKLWQGVRVFSPDQILGVFEKSAGQGRRLLVVLGEEDFDKTFQLMRLRAQKERAAVFGFVVVTSDPKNFIRRESLPVQFLDAITEKELKRDTEYHLVRALRQLNQIQSLMSQKIGPQTLEKLNQIFIELSVERNPEKLLAQILEKGIEITHAEAGSLLMVQEKDGEMCFRLRLTKDVGKEVTFHRATQRALENSLSGHAALTGKISNIPDLPSAKSFSVPPYSKEFDYEPGTPLSSILTVPLKNSRYECVAVLQLVNKRDDGPEKKIVPFDLEDESLLASFGTQAAVCLENVDLYADIQRLFDGFVRAAITAIESRDPSTGGHSERVAKMCVALARATTECNVGVYRSVKFKEEEIKELEYAAMLHDFGKIGVREEVLVKAKKLYSYQLEAIQERIKICKAAAKIQHLERQVRAGNSPVAWEKDYQDRIKQIEMYWEIILRANEPTILIEENMEALERIRSEQLLLPDGTPIALLSEDEYKALSVTKGSLTDSERLEIESHVRHTYQFLKMIPWTRDFKHLTEIAYCHHEKLDGSGYPRGLTSHEIPLQSKIMTISDIFDALTAADRWYKEAVPTEKAINILAQEVQDGKIDPVLFELFVEKKLYLLTQPKLVQQIAG
jgi:HD-GYP domain-containing protein (c-di-GMP phosphodiesterase class II)